jgi:hypothetical protein
MIIIFKSSKIKGVHVDVKKVLLFVFIVAILSGFNNYFSAKNKVNDNNSEVVAYVTEQAAEGVTQARFDEAFLKNLENWTVERVRVNGEKITGNKMLDIKSESVYVDFDGVKIAVVRVFTAVDYSAMMLGVVGNQVKRVTCLRKSPEPIVITQGVCGKKIAEVFNMKIGV